MVTNERSSGYTMVKRFLAASLATTAIGFVAVGNADAGTPRRGGVEVLELTVRNDQYQAVDLGPAGPSLGDMDVYSGTIVKDGRSVGRGGGSCQVVQLDGGVVTAQCVITLEQAGPPSSGRTRKVLSVLKRAGQSCRTTVPAAGENPVKPGYFRNGP